MVKKHHIAPVRLASEGFGDTKPIGPNDSDAGKPVNRRVELSKF